MNRFDFVRETNLIEGIHREPTQAERDEHARFIALDKVEIADLTKFVSVYEPTAVLRVQEGCNVYIGNHIPPKGGQGIYYKLQALLDDVNSGRKDAYENHIAYENLHPFSDCNGRSGRVLWAWQAHKSNRMYLSLGFLHMFYYQTLQRSHG